MFEWTGERHLPFADPKINRVEIHYEHLHKYYFALHFVKDKKVLDLACGGRLWKQAISYQNPQNTLLGGY